MSDIKVNETIENEIIELFEKNIVKPVADRVDSKAQIESTKTELSNKLNEINGSVKVVAEKVENCKSSASNNKEAIVTAISNVAQTIESQEVKIDQTIVTQSGEIINAINDFKEYCEKADKIKYGLIGAIGGIGIVLEILILILK